VVFRAVSEKDDDLLAALLISKVDGDGEDEKVVNVNRRYIGGFIASEWAPL